MNDWMLSSWHWFSAVAVVAAAVHLDSQTRLVHTLTGSHLAAGNAIHPLRTGTEAFTEMLHAIDGAAHTIGLSTYIFDNDAAGKRFIAALGRAAARGVEVRVLIDDIGARYSWPWTVLGPLSRVGVQAVRFLPQFYPWYFAYANLRCHRKIQSRDCPKAFSRSFRTVDTSGGRPVLRRRIALPPRR